MTGKKAKHRGTDYAAPKDTPVMSMFDGVVTYAGNQGGKTGFVVKVKDKAGRELKYFHLEPGSIRVKVGQKVSAGDHVAGVGKSGKSTGYHLHAELWANGVPLDLEHHLEDEHDA